MEVPSQNCYQEIVLLDDIKFSFDEFILILTVFISFKSRTKDKQQKGTDRKFEDALPSTSRFINSTLIKSSSLTDNIPLIVY